MLRPRPTRPPFAPRHPFARLDPRARMQVAAAGRTDEREEALLRGRKAGPVNMILSLYFLLLWVVGLAVTGAEAIEISIAYSAFLVLGLIVGVFAGQVATTLASGRSALLFAVFWFVLLDGFDTRTDAYALPAGDVIRALAWVGFFLSIYFAAYAFPAKGTLWRSILKPAGRDLSPTLLGALACGAGVICLGGVLWRYDFNFTLIKTIYFSGREYGSGGLFKRGLQGDAQSVLQILNYLSSAIPPLTVLSWYADGAGRRCPFYLSILASGMTVIITIMVAFEGSRSGLLSFVAAPVAIWYVKTASRHKVGATLALCAIPLVIIPIMQLQYYTRMSGGMAALSGSAKQVSLNPVNSHRDNNLYLLALVVKYVPDTVPYDGFDAWFYLIVNPIPRFLWPGKPLGIVADFENAQGAYALGPLKQGTASLSSSLVGDAFKNSGALGVIIWALIYGLLTRTIDVWITRDSLQSASFLFVYALLLYWLIMGFRADFAFVTFSYPVIVGAALMMALRRFDRLLAPGGGSA